jgi:indoleacetate---lysine synthetase
MKHSSFDIVKFNKMVAEYGFRGVFDNPREISNYDEFATSFPVSTRENIRSFSETAFSKGSLPGHYIVCTSGTTDTPLMLANRANWPRADESSYPLQLLGALAGRVIAPSDVVANLFFPGGFRVLYEVGTRLLEAIGSTIVPIGRLDSFENSTSCLFFLRKISLNVVMGSPASIVQFAQLCTQHGVELPVSKVIYSGEHFYPHKRDYVASVWPGVLFTSLYGATEFGYAGVGHSDLQPGVHRIFEDWFFFEQTDDDELLLTDLRVPLIPIIRYKMGDSGTLSKEQHGGTLLHLNGRSDRSFNCGGVIVRTASLKKMIRKAGYDKEIFQFRISCGTEGADSLTIVLDVPEDPNESFIQQCTSQFRTNLEFAEDLARGTISLHFRGTKNFKVNQRGKIPEIADER